MTKAQLEKYCVPNGFGGHVPAEPILMQLHGELVHTFNFKDNQVLTTECSVHHLESVSDWDQVKVYQQITE